MRRKIDDERTARAAITAASGLRAGLLAALSEDDLADKGSYHVNLHTHDGVIEYRPAAVQAGLESVVAAETGVEEQPAFDFEIV